LAGLSDLEAEALVVELVVTQAAIVLGHGDGGGIEATRAFTDLGFTSMTGVELRNRLSAATGLRIPLSAIFDHPTPHTLGQHIRAQMLSNDSATNLIREFEKLESMLFAISAEKEIQTLVSQRLRQLQSTWNGRTYGLGDTFADEIVSASDAEMFDLIDNELGIPE
jgi:hypothetical protein